MRSYTCTCSYSYDVDQHRFCPRCRTDPVLTEGRSTARVIECPTIYVEYRGFSQEVDTLHHETVADNNEDKRFSASFMHTPLDTKRSTVYGHSPSDVIAKVKAELDGAKWDVHYRQAIDRITKAEKERGEMQLKIDQLTAQLLPSASPADAPSHPATC